MKPVIALYSCVAILICISAQSCISGQTRPPENAMAFFVLNQRQLEALCLDVDAIVATSADRERLCEIAALSRSGQSKRPPSGPPVGVEQLCLEAVKNCQAGQKNPLERPSLCSTNIITAAQSCTEPVETIRKCAKEHGEAIDRAFETVSCKGAGDVDYFDSLMRIINFPPTTSACGLLNKECPGIIVKQY